MPLLLLAVRVQRALREQRDPVDGELLQRLRRPARLRVHHLPIGGLLRRARLNHDYRLLSGHPSPVEVQQEHVPAHQQLPPVSVTILQRYWVAASSS